MMQKFLSVAASAQKRLESRLSIEQRKTDYMYQELLRLVVLAEKGPFPPGQTSLGAAAVKELEIPSPLCSELCLLDMLFNKKRTV